MSNFLKLVCVFGGLLLFAKLALLIMKHLNPFILGLVVICEMILMFHVEH